MRYPPLDVYQPLTPIQRAESLSATLSRAPNRHEVWVFGYGSLMWNPCFSYRQRIPAVLSGYARGFSIWTTLARGTPSKPGLGLALEPCEGACHGIAYQLRTPSLQADLEAIWEREMHTGVYVPHWLPATGEHGPLTVLAFVVDPHHRQYAGRLSLAEIAGLVRGACGTYGTCRDYLAQTVAELDKLGVHEPDFDRLLQMVDQQPGLDHASENTHWS